MIHFAKTILKQKCFVCFICFVLSPIVTSSNIASLNANGAAPKKFFIIPYSLYT